jgi:hypothetical protein
MRSTVRTEVDRVLARLASQGQHGPIPIKRIFLLAADALVDAGAIERPEYLGGKYAGGQRFIQLERGRQPEIFPDYGIAPDVARLMRQRIWELYVQGVLAPGTKLNPEVDPAYPGKHDDTWVCLDRVMMTPYGTRVLGDSEDRIRVHDPDGYLAKFRNADPRPDEEMMRYVEQRVSVFRGGHFLATIVLLGVASERLVEVLAETLRDALGDPSGTEWFNNRYRNKRDLSARFKALSGKLMNEYGEELSRAKLKDAFNGVVTLTFDQMRLARNDIAHPQGREFTWNETGGFLHSFVQYFTYTNRVIAFLRAKEKAA